MTNSDARLTELESELAHLSRVVEELSAVIHRQQTEIDTLNRRAALLMQRAAEAEADASVTVPPADQKPPHW
ncbi:MAG: SlyX family protein [Paracoccaceae bacterium]